MKYIFLTFFLLLFSNLLKAQNSVMDDHIKWQFSLEKIDSNHAYIVYKAKIKDGFHIFSLSHDPSKADGTGIIPTFKVSKNSKIKVIGKPIEFLKPKRHIDGEWISMYFEKDAVFKQKIEVLSDTKFSIDFDLYFQLCDMKGCLPPFDLAGKVEVKGYKSVSENATSKNDTSFQVEQLSPTPKEIKRLKIKKPIPIIEQSNWLIFIGGFLAGLVALITPCMFPMIPMTVAFFTKQSKTKKEGIFKALVYGISIVFIYVIFGVAFTAATGPLGLNDLSTNIWMNLIFFAIFVLFAFSFLGAFEIQLPASWVNKMDKRADKGGLIGIFFMAFTLGLVSFSCTGPIIGSLLVTASTSGSYYTPAVGMTGFSLALAIPFTLFAIFPGWLNSLPKSGGWLNSVKVVLGLTELALSLKFLSSVDLAYHWDILSREWFVGIWFVLFLIMGIYLLGKLRFAHDSPIEKLSVTRFMFALVALTFSVYLLPGMFGAPLTLIDGIAPPRTHSEDNFRYVNGGLDTGIEKDSISNAYLADMHPVGDGSILVFQDLKIGTEYAKKKNLPILLDFTGHACQNCRKTESSVWTNDKIRFILQTKFVIVSLYCDDRTPLPKSEIRLSKKNGMIKTVGNKWADLQIEKYQRIQQPLYVIIDHDGNDLTETIGYTPNIDEYKAFLTEGLNAFNK